MRDYMASGENALEARQLAAVAAARFQGRTEAADKLAIMMGVEEAWLKAAFEEIDARWGSFDNYVSQGLELSGADDS